MTAAVLPATSWIWARRVPRTAAEHEAIAQARSAAAFGILVPSRLPRGYELADVDLVPYAGSMVTFVVSGPRQRAFRLTQRLSSVPLDEEIRLLRHPGTIVERRDRRFWLVRGAWAIGEPVDGWHWHRTRSTLAWQHGDVICELEQVTGRGLPLAVALDIASHVVLAPAVTSTEERRRRAGGSSPITSHKAGALN